MALRIGDILVEKQIITQQDLDMAVKEHQDTKEFLGQTLVRLNLITEEKLLKVLAEQQGIQFLELRETKISDEVIENVPAKFAWHYKIMPIRIEGNVLTVAISNPFDMWPILWNAGYPRTGALKPRLAIMNMSCVFQLSRRFMAKIL